MHLEFRHLQLVHLLSELGSIRAAAEHMGVPQPSLSRQLSRLEKSLGTSIAIRTTSGVRLTPAGEVLARHATRAVTILDEVRRELLHLTSPSESHDAIRVAASLVPAVTLDHLLAQGHNASAVTVPDDQALSMVELGEVDIALVVEDPASPYSPPPSVRTATIMATPLWVYGFTTTHRRVRTISRDDLVGIPWLAPAPGNLRSLLDNFWRSTAVTPQITLVGDIHMQLDAAENHAGIFFGQPLCGTFFEKKTTPLPLEGEPLHEKKICVWNPRVVSDSVIEGIIEAQQKTHRKIAPANSTYEAWLEAHPEALPPLAPSP
jgi:DNA-binding transcriptional LysR family regulator